MSESFAKRLAKLEARIAALRAKESVAITLKDFAQPAPANERVEAEARTYQLWPCPNQCGAKVRTGALRCAGCGADLEWPSTVV